MEEEGRAMEVSSQVVGVRTRARSREMAEAEKRRKVSEGEEFGRVSSSSSSYLQPRSRTLVVTIPEKSSSKGSLPAPGPSPSSVLGSMGNGEEQLERSSCSSNASESSVLDHEVDDDCVVSSVGEERGREKTPSSGPRKLEPATLESTATATAKKTTLVATMPPEQEIEEFFAAAEKEEAKRFAEKYNYDVAKDVPLEGRYVWSRE